MEARDSEEAVRVFADNPDAVDLGFSGYDHGPAFWGSNYSNKCARPGRT
jgi:hypothetical protein